MKRLVYMYVCVSPREREMPQCIYVEIYAVAHIKRNQESRFHKMISIHFLRRVIARELSFIFHVPNVMTRTCYRGISLKNNSLVYKKKTLT